MKFDELNIDERILRAIEDMGFEETSPIQTQAIPAVCEVLMLSDRHRQVLVRQQHTQFLCL